MVEQIKRCLEYIHYEAKYLPDGRVLIIETGASLPNLSAEEQPNLEENILQYNLKVNKGNIQRKKEIIFTLANEYEQQLKHNLHETLPQFADKLRHAVNKMDIRHNNHSGANRNEYLSQIPDDQYEQLLDDIFKCLLTLHWCADARPAFQRICEALKLLENKNE